MKLNLLIIIHCLFISAFATAENQVMVNYGLFLSPKSCLLSDKEETCDLNLNIHWETPEIDSYCLYYKGVNTAIKCWVEMDKGAIQLPISRSEPLNFELRRKNNQKIIYTTKFKLLRKTARVRHKRRNPWSFY